MMERIFHVSEEPNIEVFIPRPSPSKFVGVNNPVVFGVGERLIHNYLLPRDCPRVTFYASEQTSDRDKSVFDVLNSQYVVYVESSWVSIAQNTKLFLYEFQSDHFRMIDENACYYVSENVEYPQLKIVLENAWDEISSRKDVELRIVDNLQNIAQQISQSTLHFSIIRLRNAKK